MRANHGGLSVLERVCSRSRRRRHAVGIGTIFAHVEEASGEGNITICDGDSGNGKSVDLEVSRERARLHQKEEKRAGIEARVGWGDDFGRWFHWSVER